MADQAAELVHLRAELAAAREQMDWLEAQTVFVRDPETGELLFARTAGASPIRRYIDDTRAALAARQEGGRP